MDKTKWQFFWFDIKDKTKSPFNHPEFLGYFFLAIVLTGSLGVTYTILTEWGYVKSLNKIPSSIATYFMTLMAVGVLDINLSEKWKQPRIIYVYSLIAGFMGIVLLVFSNLLTGISAYFFSFSGTLLAWYIWWLANADNEKLTSKIKPDSATGGDPYKNLPGSINNYRI
jgi:hypothetical protein